MRDSRSVLLPTSRGLDGMRDHVQQGRTVTSPDLLLPLPLLLHLLLYFLALPTSSPSSSVRSCLLRSSSSSADTSLQSWLPFPSPPLLLATRPLKPRARYAPPIGQDHTFALGRPVLLHRTFRGPEKDKRPRGLQ